MSHAAPRELAPFADGRLWTAWRPQRFFGIEMGTRMTVCRLSSGALWVHSPIDVGEQEAARIRALGPVAHVVAPSRIHHLYVRDFVRHFPGAAIYGSPRLPAKRPDLSFASVLGDAPEPGWASDIDQCLMRGNLYLDEVVFFHRPSRTLILADLLEEGNADWPLLSRVAARLAGIYRRHAPPRDMKLMFRHDKRATRRSVERILAWDFERIVLSHGSLVRERGREVFRAAYEFALSW